jgi:hypothetical protein
MSCRCNNLLFTTYGYTKFVPAGRTVPITDKCHGDICTEGYSGVLVVASAAPGNTSDITICLHVENRHGCDRTIEAFTLSPGETARCFQCTHGNDISISAFADGCHGKNLLSCAVYGQNRV